MANTYKHGLSGYTNFQCRCATCTNGMKMWQRGAAVRRAATDPPTHGCNGYKNYRCRCAVCSAAKAKAERHYREIRSDG